MTMRQQLKKIAHGQRQLLLCHELAHGPQTEFGMLGDETIDYGLIFFF
jgi:hypothetical protein